MKAVTELLTNNHTFFLSFSLLQVSWVRQKDLYILASGRQTYIRDSRFKSINLINSNEWILEIKDTKLSDSGTYECQISTNPKLSTSVFLQVIGNLNFFILFLSIIYQLNFEKQFIECEKKEKEKLHANW